MGSTFGDVKGLGSVWLSRPSATTLRPMFLLPAIDLLDGRVVRLLKGDYDRKTTYGDDPLEQARAFESAGSSWLHVVDLSGARSGQPEHLEQIRAICAGTQLKVEVGGGIRDTDTVNRLLDAGVRRVILGTAALREWAWFESLAQQPDMADRLVLGLDARKGLLAISGWEQTTETTALEIARRVKGWALSAIVFTDIDTDGTLAGPNLDSTRAMAEATDVPIVASGGVGSLDDLRALRTLPIQGSIVGRALYDGAFTIEEALAAFEHSAA